MSESEFPFIGGEFECDLPLLSGEKKRWEQEGFFCSSGRAALFHILAYIRENLNRSFIYLPDYLCGSIIDTAYKSGFKVKFYPVSKGFLPEMDFLSRQPLADGVILVINYFGCLELKKVVSDLKNLAGPAYIITDNVQGYFSMESDDEADFSFTSFRKMFPVPDGAWVKSKYQGFAACTEENMFLPYKLAGSMLKALRRFNSIGDGHYLSFLEKGEMLIDENIQARMSDVTSHILAQLDLSGIASKRRRNAAYLIKGLQELGISPLCIASGAAVPLFVPVSLKDRDVVRKLLFEENIFCPVHWPCRDAALHRGYEMAQSELSLIIDQRYGLEDMDRITHVLSRHYGI